MIWEILLVLLGIIVFIIFIFALGVLVPQIFDEFMERLEDE